MSARPMSTGPEPEPPVWEEEAAPAAIGPHPRNLAFEQGERALDWLDAMRAGQGIPWMWPGITDLTGRLAPTWAVYVGGYPKTAKTTLLQTQARWWAETGTPVCYVGTETTQEILRLQSAALTLQLPVELVVTGERRVRPGEVVKIRDDQVARVKADIARQQVELADWLMFADTRRSTLDEVLYWIAWGADHGAAVVIFDHLHRLDTGGGSDRYGQLADAVRKLTEAANAHGVLFVCAAQFRENRGDPLANHECPSDSQWFGGSAIQQEGTCNLQLWRPLRAGISDDDRGAVRRGEAPLSSVLKPNCIGVRVSAHRFRPGSYGEIAHLRIVDDVIDEWPRL
jgi:hypothetical protein